MTLVDSFVNFCESSTIHGISFWSSAKSIAQKILWVFIVFLGIGSASFMIWNNFQTWAANPVVVSVVQVPIEQAPYPSVTICPLESTPFGSIEDIINRNYGQNSKMQNLSMSILTEFLSGSLKNRWEEGLETLDDCSKSICEGETYSSKSSCIAINRMFQKIADHIEKNNNEFDSFHKNIFKVMNSDHEFNDEGKEFEDSFSGKDKELCEKIYGYSKMLLRIQDTGVLRSKKENMKIGTLLSWLYNHAEDMNNVSLSSELKAKILKSLNPSQIPETSSRRQFDTFDDIFLPSLAQILIGGFGLSSNANIQGLKYSKSLYDMMKYSQTPMEVFKSSGEINQKPGIPFCLFASSDEKGKKIGSYPEKYCRSMQPIMNEDGLCYTYNNVDFKMESESDFNDSLVNIQGVGHKKGLTLLVDSQMIKNRARSEVSLYEGYKVIVTVPGAIAAKVSFIVEPDYPGEHSFYLHGIHYITASPDVIEWNKNAKVCYFPQNKKLTYYNHYIQDNCLQECKLKKISNQCNCSPWFINQTDLPICNELGMSCFKDKAENYQDDLIDRSECDCKNDCEMVHFFYSMRQEGYNREWFNPQTGNGFLNNYLLDPNQVFTEPLTHNLTQVLYDMDDVEIAKDRFSRDIVILNFFFDTPIISNFKLEMKVTIFDQISAIGGTLGLFAGISLISMFEIVYWIFKASMDGILGFFGFKRSSSASIEPKRIKDNSIGFRQPVFNSSF